MHFKSNEMNFSEILDKFNRFHNGAKAIKIKI